MTKGMVATMLHRLSNQPYVAYEEIFADVKDGQYYSQVITWATKNKIINGYNNGCFGPDDSITREQKAAMSYNYAKFVYGRIPNATISLYRFGVTKNITTTRAGCTKMLYQLKSILPKK